MPDKDGDEGKSTKSVVNKKQKQMMGEEGYDIARDMGKVRPSKDKKDATTMPVSDEVKKTQKVVKGPSAFERVKAKYGKSVMNVGKKKANEELDLTKVAEAFGGYIIEAEAKSGGKSKGGSEKNKKDAEDAAEMSKKRGEFAKSFGKDPTKASDDEQAALGDLEGRKVATDPKQGGYSRVSDVKKPGGGQIKGRERFAEFPGAGKVTSYNPRKGEKSPKEVAAKKQRISDTLKTAKPTDIKGGPSVRRGDPVPQEVKPVKKKPVPEIGGFQPNTFKPETGQQTFDKMFGPDSKVRRIQTGEKPEIPDPFGDKTKPKKSRKSRTIPFKDRKQLDPETQKKVDAVTPAFATRIGASGKPLPVSMRNLRVPPERSIEKLKPSQKGNIIVKPGKTKPKDPGINPEVTDENPNQRRAGVGNRTLPGTPPKTGPGFGKRFGDFLQFTRNNPVASLIGYDILRKTAGKVKSELKPAGVKGGRAVSYTHLTLPTKA